MPTVSEVKMLANPILNVHTIFLEKISLLTGSTLLTQLPHQVFLGLLIILLHLIALT